MNPVTMAEVSRWLPKGVEPNITCFALTGAERRVLRKRRPVRPSEWAERHRVLTMSALQGSWRNSVTPYLAGIMDAWAHNGVEEVVVCKSPQVGCSEAAHNTIGYAIDRAPGPALYVYPDQDTARENSRDRILPMIKSSPRLRSYLTGAEDDEASTRINLQHMPIYLGWARSAARLANKPVRHLVLDEVDKYPETASKREADPISLARKRTQTYKYDRKIWIISTPTVESAPIWQAMMAADAVYHYWVRCPECGAWQRMQFDFIRWPKIEGKSLDHRKILSGKLAWYECAYCGAHWDDEARNQAVRLGEWREIKTGAEIFTYLKAHGPRTVGFHIPSWLSFFVSLSEVAASFLKSKGDRIALRDFWNNYMAEPWVDYQIERSEDRILALRDDRPQGVVPGHGRVAGITAGVDTQDDGFWYEIRAWGYGLTQESWQIKNGFVTSLDALEQVVWGEALLDTEENEHQVELLVIDAMGHRTVEVYDWARAHRGRAFAFKGEATMSKLCDFSFLEFYPGGKGRKRPIPGGLTLLRANVNFFKSRLSSLLEVAPADPGAWRLHAECDAAWAAQMCVEYVNDKGLWECPAGRANHAWDCSVYNLVAAEVRRIKHRPRAAAKKRPVDDRAKRSWVGSSGSWFGR